MNICQVTLCDVCGVLTLVYRGNGGAVAAAVAESEAITADDVVDDIRTALYAAHVRPIHGTCWVCVCETHVSRETLRPDVVADDPQDATEELE